MIPHNSIVRGMMWELSTAQFFYADEQERKAAYGALEKAQKEYEKKIVTQIVPFVAFYPAEDYHKDYYDKNRNAAYCRIVINPKIQKLYSDFKENLKKEET